MKRTSIVLFAVAILGTSCSIKTHSHVEYTTTNGIGRDGKIWASLWQQRAAEYKALCYQAYNVARLRIDEAIQKKGSKTLAIVTDIDETILDNSPNAVSQSLAGKGFEQQAWHEWTAKASADTVPGAPAFFKYAASRGVEIFYISNRDDKELDATLKNLRKYDFPQADLQHLMLRNSESGKEQRRLEVLKNHDIVMLLGDNLADFSKLFDKLDEAQRDEQTRLQAAEFGKRFIIIPNAGYGDWENALFNYDFKKSQAEKDAIIKQSLRKD